MLQSVQVSSQAALTSLLKVQNQIIRAEKTKEKTRIFQIPTKAFSIRKPHKKRKLLVNKKVLSAPVPMLQRPS